MEWALVDDTNTWTTCGAARGPRSQTRCELPPDHVTGRATGQPSFTVYHFGRSPSGRWFSWLPEVR